jgi:tight adherence protein C
VADLKQWMRPFAAVGRGVMGSGLLSQKAIGDLEQTMSAAGYRSGSAVALFLGAKIALVTALPALAWFVVKLTGFIFIKPMIVLGFAAVIGLLLPDFIVGKIRKRYLDAVDDGLPAALDLLIICAEAGLALEAGFERVSAEFEEGSRPTANELRNTATEMKILSDRRQALVNMGTRTGLESMIRLGGMLAQSQKYGTSLTQALRTLSAEMRAIALTRFEARAARLPVLLTIPMILFILPCIFVVVAGPAAVQIMQIMRAH